MVPESFLVDKIYDNDKFANVEEPLHRRDESHLVMMDYPFKVLLDSISQDLVENFGVHIHYRNGSVIPFLMGLCLVCGSREYWPNRMSLVFFLLFLFFEIALGE